MGRNIYYEPDYSAKIVCARGIKQHGNTVYVPLVLKYKGVKYTVISFVSDYPVDDKCSYQYIELPDTLDYI